MLTRTLAVSLALAVGLQLALPADGLARALSQRAVTTRLQRAVDHVTYNYGGRWKAVVLKDNGKGTLRIGLMRQSKLGRLFAKTARIEIDVKGSGVVQDAKRTTVRHGTAYGLVRAAGLFAADQLKRLKDSPAARSASVKRTVMAGLMLVGAGFLGLTPDQVALAREVIVGGLLANLVYRGYRRQADAPKTAKAIATEIEQLIRSQFQSQNGAAQPGTVQPSAGQPNAMTNSGLGEGFLSRLELLLSNPDPGNLYSVQPVRALR
ncbi:MAG: hypothetical protein H6707_13375 [Deltaproteobacteria bacterium]|nr:hypothetical protein [Deltaproteobacteria bacterium]